MSQEKVDKYKESKKNRKEEVAKQKKIMKRRKLTGWIILAVVVVGLVAGLVITIVNNEKAKTESQDEMYNESAFLLEDYANIEGTTAAEDAE